VRGWGVSVLVGWTDMDDFAARPIQLIAGRTWKGSLFGGEMPVKYCHSDRLSLLIGSHVKKAGLKKE